MVSGLASTSPLLFLKQSAIYVKRKRLNVSSKLKRRNLPVKSYHVNSTTLLDRVDSVNTEQVPRLPLAPILCLWPGSTSA